MFIDLTCPSCRTTFQVPDRLAGKGVRCKSCREEFRAAAAESAPAPRRSSANHTAVLVAGFGVFALVVAGGVGYLIYYVNRNVEPPIPGLPVAVRPAVGVPPPGPVLAPVQMGEEIFVLSNPRRTKEFRGLFGQRGYEVDYAFKGGKKLRFWHDHDFVLVARTATVTSQLRLSADAELRRDSGTISFQEVFDNRLKGEIEIYLGRGHGFRAAERVSNVVTLDAD